MAKTEILTRQIVLGYDEYGKQIRKRIRGKNAAELAREEAKARLEFEEGHNPSVVTFRTYRLKWFDAYKSSKEINTKASYEYVFTKFAAIDPLRVRDITRTDLQQIIVQNADHPNTCIKISNTLRQIFDAALGDGIVKYNPALRLELPKVPKPEYYALDKIQKAALSDIVLEDQDRIFLLVLRSFGLRPEEARALMSSDFDFENNNVVIKRAAVFDGEKAVIKTTKTDNERMLPVPDAAAAALKKYIKGLRSLYLFTYDEGKLWSKTVYRHAWKRIRKALCIAAYGWQGVTDQVNRSQAKIINDANMAKLKGFTPYVFRREYATQLYYSGISIKKAAQLMGHADSKMIMKVYAQIDDERENLDELRKMVL